MERQTEGLKGEKKVKENEDIHRLRADLQGMTRTKEFTGGSKEGNTTGL